MATTWIEPWELTGFNSSFPFLEPIHPLIYLSYLSVTLFFRKPYPQTRTQTREVVDAATSKPQSSLRCGTYIQIETSENPSIICFFSSFPFSFFLFLLIPFWFPFYILGLFCWLPCQPTPDDAFATFRLFAFSFLLFVQRSITFYILGWHYQILGILVSFFEACFFVYIPRYIPVVDGAFFGVGVDRYPQFVCTVTMYHS